jgi:hypothetical protein
MADPVGERPPDEPKPFLPLMFFSFGANFLLHQLYPAPAAGEDTRGYLHGGLMIDFIGQQGPTSKWKLGALDMCILLLQLVMVAVHVKRRELKKKLANISAGHAVTPSAPATSATSAAPAAAASEPAARGQDADDEERGVLRRTDTRKMHCCHLQPTLASLTRWTCSPPANVRLATSASSTPSCKRTQTTRLIV